MRVLASYGTASQQTYAFSLVDHLNWLHINGIQTKSVTFDDLRRYMNALTNEGAEIFVPWRRADQRPLGASSACNVATVVKAFYMSLLKSGTVNEDLVCKLNAPASRTQRGTFVQRNPLAPKRTSRRPRVVTDATVQALFETGHPEKRSRCHDRDLAARHRHPGRRPLRTEVYRPSSRCGSSLRATPIPAYPRGGAQRQSERCSRQDPR